MKKVLILFTIILFLCGCDIEYNLDFNDNQLSESIDIKLERDDSSEEDLNAEFNFDLYSIINKDMYDVDVHYDDYRVIGNYSYTYSINNFKDANLINTCFEYFDFFEEDNNYYIVTNGAYRCISYEYEELNELNIKIKTNHKVVDNNANEINDNTYIWKITPDNVNNVNILFVVEKEVTEDAKANHNANNYMMNIIIGLLLSAVIAIVTILVYTKNKKNNEI